jgi:hypothetical protein
VRAAQRLIRTGLLVAVSWRQPLLRAVTTTWSRLPRSALEDPAGLVHPDDLVDPTGDDDAVVRLARCDVSASRSRRP